MYMYMYMHMQYAHYIVRALINFHNFEIKLHGRKNFCRPAHYAALSKLHNNFQILLFLYKVSQTYGEFKN